MSVGGGGGGGGGGFFFQDLGREGIVGEAQKKL